MCSFYISSFYDKNNIIIIVDLMSAAQGLQTNVKFTRLQIYFNKRWQGLKWMCKTWQDMTICELGENFAECTNYLNEEIIIAEYC